MFSLAYDRNDGGGAMYHRLTMEGREKLTVAGVEDVERFDENCIVMSTCAGTLVVTGEGLHIGKLSLDGGELHVDGRISTLRQWALHHFRVRRCGRKQCSSLAFLLGER